LAINRPCAVFHLSALSFWRATPKSLLTSGVEADLVSLGRVNTLETNLGCTNGEGIAVNNSGYAREFGSIRAASDEYHRRQR
jgi:hypothetical protein